MSYMSTGYKTLNSEGGYASIYILLDKYVLEIIIKIGIRPFQRYSLLKKRKNPNFSGIYPGSALQNILSKIQLNIETPKNSPPPGIKLFIDFTKCSSNFI